MSFLLVSAAIAHPLGDSCLCFFFFDTPFYLHYSFFFLNSFLNFLFFCFCLSEPLLSDSGPPARHQHRQPPSTRPFRPCFLETPEQNAISSRGLSPPTTFLPPRKPLLVSFPLILQSTLDEIQRIKNANTQDACQSGLCTPTAPLGKPSMRSCPSPCTDRQGGPSRSKLGREDVAWAGPGCL